MPARIVTVFGSSSVAPGESVYEAAFQLGRAIAELGLTL